MGKETNLNYSPQVENNSANYIKYLAKEIGIAVPIIMASDIIISAALLQLGQNPNIPLITAITAGGYGGFRHINRS